MNTPTASELIDALHKAGATLVVEDGKARVRGAKVSESLMAAVKAQRDAVVVEWQRRQEAALDRWGEVPTGNVEMSGWGLVFDEKTSVAMCSYVFRQPRTIHAWVMQRSAEYHAHGAKMEDCDRMACVDVVAWQRACGGKDAVKFVMELA